MEKRNLGNSDLKIAPLIFGGNVFGWTIDEAASFKLIDTFIGEGFNCIDTADVYSIWKQGNQGGESETIIGNWFKKTGKRKEVIICTKVGMELSPEKKGLSKKYILKEVEDSLKRLQTDYIDLYQSHKDDEDTPIDETLEAYSELINAGKVRFIGCSNFSPERLEKSMQVSKEKNLPYYASLQPKYNLYDREFENEYSDVVKKYAIGVMPYSALASGFLSGKYQSEADFSKSVRGGGMKKYLNNKGFKIIKLLNELSQKYSCPTSAISLAWLLQNPLVTAPIASATNEKQLKEIMQSVNITIAATDMNLLNRTNF